MDQIDKVNIKIAKIFNNATIIWTTLSYNSLHYIYEVILHLKTRFRFNKNDLIIKYKISDVYIESEDLIKKLKYIFEKNEIFIKGNSTFEIDILEFNYALVFYSSIVSRETVENAINRVKNEMTEYHTFEYNIPRLPKSARK